MSDVNKARTLKAKTKAKHYQGQGEGHSPRPMPRPRPSRLGMKLVLYRHERPWVS